MSRSAVMTAALVLVVALAGCGGSSATPAPASAAPASAAAGAVFTVIKADGSQVPVTMDDLKKLEVVTIQSDGQPQEGPSLTAVLGSVGVTTFTSVTVTGPSSSKTLAQAEVTADVILDFNNRGLVKLVSPTMAKADRVIDVATIQVK